MQVVILCGGLGTRLREETEYRPILWHIMKTYAAHGHKDFILCLGYKGEVIREFFLNYLAMTSDLTLRLGRNASVEYHSLHDEEDWSVPFVETGLKTMTGGRRARALPWISPASMPTDCSRRSATAPLPARSTTAPCAAFRARF